MKLKSAMHGQSLFYLNSDVCNERFFYFFLNENQILRKTSSGSKGLTYVGGDRHTNMEHLACFSGKFNIDNYLEINLE